MAKDKLTEYDATAANNTVVGDVNLAENSALPSDMNNAVREVMSHQKEAFGSGTPLYVDQTNNRVGIGNSAPSTALEVDAAGATVLTVDRATSDGTIVDLQKNGTSVGAIGVAASDDFYIGASTANHAGVYFGTDIVYPMRANSLSDGVTSLGHSSNRFNNLYLSGGAYLGGTAAANALSHFETGTFTPTGAAPSGSFTSQSGSGFYTKVGNQVFVYGHIKITDVGSGSGGMNFAGFPFAGSNRSFPAGNRSGLLIMREDQRTGTFMHMFLNAAATSGGINMGSHTVATNDTFVFTGVYHTG